MNNSHDYDDDIPVSIIYLKETRGIYEVSHINTYFEEELQKIDVKRTEFTGDIKKYISEDLDTLKRLQVSISVSKKVINATVSYTNKKIYVEVMVCGNSFVRFINHELKTPIMSNIELLNLLSATKMNKYQEEILGMMKINALEFTRTLNDTMEYLKLSGKKININITDFNLNTLVEDIKPIIKHEKVAIVYPEQNFKIRSDYTKVIYILKSIINNCMLSKGTRYIYIKASSNGSGGGDGNGKVITRFSISDDGDKMEDDRAILLFNGFLNISDEMITHKRHSTGLGMVVSKQLSKALGGDLTLVYNEDYGNTYRFTLPSL